jgi:hypothetical protein
LNAEKCMYPSQTPSILTHTLGADLEVLLFALLALTLALADNLLAEPLGLEAALQGVKVHDDVTAALDDGVLRCDGAVSGDAEFEGREQWVGNLVCGEDDIVVLEEALGDQVAERVVFFVEGEDGRVGDACCGGVSTWRGS